jgi:hypothetical protein
MSVPFSVDRILASIADGIPAYRTVVEVVGY